MTDGDVLDILRMWLFHRNCHRASLSQGSSFVLSTFFGYIGGQVTKATGQYPSVPELLNRWLRARLAPGTPLQDFCWSAICLNKNLQCQCHRDKNNSGPSVLAAFGPYREGGNLRYHPQDDGRVDLGLAQALEPTEVDPRSHLVLFDGGRAHSVTPFEGERYSVVFFDSRDGSGMGRAARELLNRLRARPRAGDELPPAVPQPLQFWRRHPSGIVCEQCWMTERIRRVSWWSLPSRCPGDCNCNTEKGTLPAASPRTDYDRRHIGH
ncbi:MAG: hypothetical protein GY769_00900 [bacterium]|nr:hypothetical protein [bacterium]